MTLVLLTGASGFLGSHVLQRLLEQNHQVRVFVRAPEKLRENLGLLGVPGRDVGDVSVLVSGRTSRLSGDV